MPRTFVHQGLIGIALTALAAATSVRSEEPYPVAYEKKMLAFFEKWRAETRKSTGMEYRFRLSCLDRDAQEVKRYHGQAKTLITTAKANEWDLAAIEFQSDTPNTLHQQTLCTKETICQMDFLAKSIATLPTNYKTAPQKSDPNTLRFSDIQKTMLISEADAYRTLLSPTFPDDLGKRSTLVKEDNWYLYFDFGHLPELRPFRGRLVLQKDTGLPRQLHFESEHYGYTLDIDSVKSRSDLRACDFNSIPTTVPETWVDRFELGSRFAIKLMSGTNAPKSPEGDSQPNQTQAAPSAK